MKLYKDIFTPDPRNLHYTILNLETYEERAVEFNDHYEAVSRHRLEDYVPEEVKNQYGVARNLYVYSWYVFEFYNVAHSKLLSTLEYALKKAIPQSKLDEFIKVKNRRNSGLATLLMYVELCENLKSSDFPQWHRVKDRKGLLTSEFQREYFSLLVKELPKLRNNYFHGSTALYDDVLGLFEDFCVIVNYLFKPKCYQEK